MKKFVFRLAAALMARNADLELKQGDLADVNNRLALAEELVAARETEFNELAKAGPQKGVGFDPAFELQRQRHLDHLRNEMETRRELVRRLEAERDEAQAHVAEAYRAVRALEIIKENDREKWLLEFKREEQKMSDDRNSQRYGR
jgi:flagellar export protein FliJ